MVWSLHSPYLGPLFRTLQIVRLSHHAPHVIQVTHCHANARLTTMNTVAKVRIFFILFVIIIL